MFEIFVPRKFVPSSHEDEFKSRAEHANGARFMLTNILQDLR